VHAAIIDQPLWHAVRAQLTGNTAERNAGTRTHQSSLQMLPGSRSHWRTRLVTSCSISTAGTRSPRGEPRDDG
jgi:hypothetical protein